MNHGKIFFDPPPRVTKIKPKINKWDLIKLKNSCTVNETLNKMKRQPSIGAYIRKLSNRQGIISLQSTQTAHAVPYKKKTPNQKRGGRPK